MAAELDIREQPRLSIAKQIELTADGIHHRWARSALAASVVVLAVAFLMNSLLEQAIARSCQQGLGRLVARERELTWLAAVLAEPTTGPQLQRQLASLPAGSGLLDALAPALKMTSAELSEIQDRAVATEAAYTWFDELRTGHRRLLVGKLDRDTCFERWNDRAERERFMQAARQIPLSLPESFETVTAGHRELQQSLTALAAKQNAVVAALKTRMGDGTPIDWLAAASQDAAARRSLEAALEAQRVMIPADLLERLIDQAVQEQENQRLRKALGSSAIVSGWTRQFGGVFSQNEVLPVLASDRVRQRWLAERLEWSPERIGDAATRILQTQRINRLHDSLVHTYGTTGGMGSRTLWLIVVSLMVCVAGISNAMLVSVLERFREIATMKCLGALNGFIVTLFLLEAAFLGLVGGVLGVLLGGAIAIVRMLLGYGGWVGTFFPWMGLAQASGVSVLCGGLLATLAAAYPAYLAARMPPVEAMRVE